jgi:RHS repeat-associated protein
MLKATPNAKVAIASKPVMLKATAPVQELNFGFLGWYRDPENGPGVFYNSQRDAVSALVNRYFQADPTGLDGGLNRTEYVEGDALQFADPEGLVRRSGQAMRPQVPALRPPPRPAILEPVFTHSTETMTQCGVCLRVYYVARLDGQQSGHRDVANRQFHKYLSSSSGPRNFKEIQRQMEAGGSGLRNPTGYEWHHQPGRPNELWLVTRCDHRAPELRPFIHNLPKSGGGWAAHYGGTR